MRMFLRFLLLLALVVSAWAADPSSAPSRFTYQKPPKIVTDVLESPALPTVVVSPRGDRMLVVQTRRHPSIADLAQPMLRIAGLRINPATNGPHHPPRHTGFSLVTFASGQSHELAVPANAYLSLPEWAGDGKHFAFTNTVANGIELWIGDADTGTLRRIPGVVVNAAYRGPIQWMPDNRTLLVKTTPVGRGKPPVDGRVPEGPNVQESSGKPAPIRTYEDLLQNPYDETLYEYYCTSQLALVDVASGRLTPVGKPALFWSVSPSPDGQHLLVTYNHRPYSYLLPASDFPKEVEVWDLKGNRQYTLASLPLAEHVPMEGVLTGPREYEWRPNKPASLTWVEALDGGDPKAKASFRDRLLTVDAPYRSGPQEVVKLEQRFQTRFGLTGSAAAMSWVDGGEKALVSDYDRDRRWVRTFLVDFDHPGAEAKLIWSRSVQDRYNDPGLPVMRTLPNGFEVALQSGTAIYLRGNGASANGDHPFLDRYDLAKKESERLFQSSETSYESVTAVLDDSATRFVTQFESPSDYPNFFLREKGSPEKKRLTEFRDPAPQLKLIKKQLVKYKRDDGVGLSFTLYLPPDCDSSGNPPRGWTTCRHAEEKLPSIVWAYPLEYNDAATAGQVSGSPYRFTQINGMSELWLVTQGYAILDNATMPVIGNPETMNDTYVQQVVSSAKAAIDKAAEMGVTDPNRVGVGGHSYGAFMTANLLAHSDLFRAGVARSGAYNRTLTPFGFQSERRTFWEAEDTYMKVSPFAFADKIKRPILLIHGEADDNSGTFPIQSERMYQALKGNGATVRYVTLPYEAHGYLGLESVEHTVWEMITWFDKWVKNPTTRDVVAGSSE